LLYSDGERNDGEVKKKYYYNKLKIYILYLSSQDQIPYGTVAASCRSRHGNINNTTQHNKKQNKK
jgi:hypothetical protein